MRSASERNYLNAAVQNASQVGLVIIVMDLLVADLRRVIEAMSRGEIEKRTAELNHAFLALQQLEGSLDLEHGGEAAKNFSRFYSAVRAKLLEAHIKVDPELFQRQIDLILDVRAAWEQVDRPAAQQLTNSAQTMPVYDEREVVSSGWSA